MLSFLKKSSPIDPVSPSESPKEKTSLLARFKKGLSKTRHQLVEGLATLVMGEKVIDASLIEEIEDFLLSSDLGVEATASIINSLTAKISRKELTSAALLWATLKEQLIAVLQTCERPLEIPENSHPFVILIVGVNGVGKTTTIAKLAYYFQQQGKKVMLAAGDTFRAAAIEQLMVWGERINVPVIAQKKGADSASVIFDALAAAKARGMDVLIADTAGRLHTKENLMQELQKVKRVLLKLDNNAPQEVLLVIDAGTGQNTLTQVHQFNTALPLTGLVITKLDGTAKGGILFSLAKKINMPIRFVGLGESIDDLQPFNANMFVDALFTKFPAEE